MACISKELPLRFSQSASNSVTRLLPLAVFATLSTLCNEAVAKPFDNAITAESSATDLQLVVSPSEADSESGTGFMAPLVLSQSSEETTDATQQEDEEDNWRVYLDLYAFLPPTTSSTSTVEGNTTKVDLPLSDVINSLDEALTLKASFEYGRVGVLAAINYATLSTSASKSSFLETQNPLKNKAGISSPLRSRTIRIQGDLDVDVDANQTIFDLAMRYRAGAIQKPRMKKGSTSFLGLVGARFIDANLSTDFSIKGDADVTVEGVKVNRSNSRELEKSSNASWGNTWVQPMVGMFGTYAISEDWQAFAYLDAGGFGLSGSQDLSGTAQAGIAYALGNSAQVSLSYKYFGIAYFEGGGDNNGYSSYQSGVNLGLRWLFD